MAFILLIGILGFIDYMTRGEIIDILFFAGLVVFFLVRSHFQEVH